MYWWSHGLYVKWNFKSTKAVNAGESGKWGQEKAPLEVFSGVYPETERSGPGREGQPPILRSSAHCFPHDIPSDISFIHYTGFI